MKKLTIEFIKSRFEKEGYNLLSKEYINPYKKLNYICPNGHKHQISWSNWNHPKKYRCVYCVGNVRLTIDFIKKEFEKEGYKLLTKVYKNAHQKLDYICPKGHRHSIRWNDWQRGRRCSTCKVINMSGEKHHNWKGGISCEPYCQDWTKEFKDYIKERDGHKCLNPDCFRNIYRLSVHYIDYNKKNCEPQNLITLCTSCNSRANKDRSWHEAWYESIIWSRYFKGKGENNNVDFTEW